MFERLKTWIKRFSAVEATPEAPLRRSGAHPSPRPAAGKPRARREPPPVEIETHTPGRIVQNGPGKNVLIRSRYVREDTGTHETLTILDDSLIDSGEETGIDPYNTGGFDRSRNWDKRFRN